MSKGVGVTIRNKSNRAKQNVKINNNTRKANESRYHRIIRPNMYVRVKALAKAEGISDVEAYDKIMYDAAHY